MELKDKDGVEITNKSFSMKKLKQSKTTLHYGSFLKSATLLANVGKEETIEGHIGTDDIEIKPFQVLSDADLLKACGGRTAHKGARHGLNLTGKLQRIAEQERILLEKMKDKKHKHEVFQEPYAKKVKKNPLAELNSSKDDTSDDALPVDDESDYILNGSKKRKKRERKQELQLVTQINGIGLNEASTSTTPADAELEEDEAAGYNGTPTRRKKKSKKLLERLCAIEEASQEPSSDEQNKKRKKKKGKRKLEEDDEMPECREKYLKEKPAKKVKKAKLNDSYEASEDDEDVADKINAEHEAMKNSKKKSKTAKKRDKQRAKEVAKDLAENL